MKSRILLVALAAAASFTTPAHAASGMECLTISTSAPRGVAQTGPDLVVANLAVSNYCAWEGFVVDLLIRVENVCDHTGCSERLAGSSQGNVVEPFSENGFEVTGTCFEGRHFYALEWVITSSSGRVVDWRNTSYVEVRCNNDVPAGPGIECPKHIQNFCRDIA